MIPPNDPRLENIVYLIQKSALDETIKDILIRDLQAEGLSDFLKEQIKVYCDTAINLIDERLRSAHDTLAS